VRFGICETGSSLDAGGVTPESSAAGLRCNVGTLLSVRFSKDRTIPIDLETVGEARLVVQALAGSQSAFEQIVARYQRPVISLIARMTGDRAQAEDLAQETFVKAFRSLAAFDTTRRLSSWLFRIAHNTAIDAMRRSHPQPASIDAAGPDEPATPVGPDPVERQELGRALKAALAELRPDQRAAIVLRYENGLSFDEIGTVLGIPEVTARSHVHRARKELARLLTASGWAPGK
jgi:RNA polymerase sigma-70 factor, ECF subfamily